MTPLRPEHIAEVACGTPLHDAFELEVLNLLDQHIGADVCFFSRSGGVSPVALGLDVTVRPAAERRWARMGLKIGRLAPEAQREGGWW